MLKQSAKMTRMMALAASMAVSGCVVYREPPPRRVYVEPQPVVYEEPAPPATEVVVDAPPADQVEIATAQPGPDYVWIGGRWGWRGHAYVWIGGTWGHRPRPYAVWVRGHWGHVPGGWRYIPGHWG